MSENRYIAWLTNESKAKWWHDSAMVSELEESLREGAVGATTNPALINAAVTADPGDWKPYIAGAAADAGEKRACGIIAGAASRLAGMLRPVYERTGGADGYVCAQVSPCRPGDMPAMMEMARRYRAAAPNISVKLPATKAGLDAAEECAAMGIPVTLTVSFTAPQLVSIGERCERGLERARRAGIRPAPCVAVIMVGRLDDYLRDVAQDSGAAVSESDITLAGIAATKRAYRIFSERGYTAAIMPAGMRGAYHLTELAGRGIVFSLAPKIKEMTRPLEGPFEDRIEAPVDEGAVRRLLTMPEFVRAYEPDGMRPEEFIAFGATQRTLTQFVETGWLPLERHTL